ncbi:uncharacterized protein LOC136767576 isoform X2 [Amia ocellicauda]
MSLSVEPEAQDGAVRPETKRSTGPDLDSEMSLSVEPEAQDGAVRPETKRVPSCLSMRSEDSMHNPVHFREDPFPPDPRVPSCLSMRSEDSMHNPVHFREDPFPPDPRVPSCLSMRSEDSMHNPVHFREDPFPPDPRSTGPDLDSEMSLSVEPEAQDGAVRPKTKRVPLQRAESPVPSCLSMRSEDSMHNPVHFREDPFPPDPRSTGPDLDSEMSLSVEPEAQDGAVRPKTKRVPLQRAESPVPSCLSMRSEDSMHNPVHFREDPFPPDPRSTGPDLDSEMSLSVEPEAQDGAVRPETKRVPSCLSMRSEDSMHNPVHFREDPFPPDPRSTGPDLDSEMSLSVEPEAQDGAVRPETKRVPLQRAESPVPSCLSMRSEDSMHNPVHFREDPFPPDPRSTGPDLDSEMSLSVEPEAQDGAVRPKTKRVPSCLSMRSEDSMHNPVHFREDPFPPDPRSTGPDLDSEMSLSVEPEAQDGAVRPETKRVPLQRAESPVPSCLSMRSEDSMHNPVHFREDPFPPDPRVPSCLSMRSEDSMHNPVHFREDPFPPDPRSTGPDLDSEMSLSVEPEAQDGAVRPKTKRVPLQRAESPVPSCLSMRSEDSMHNPVHFREDPFPPDPRVPLQRAESPVPSCLSMRSEDSMHNPVHFREDPFPPDPSSLSDEEMPAHSYARPRDVACDLCTGRKSRAVKSCLTCAASYCETHVRQHYTVPALQTHRLEDTTGDLEHRLCQQHRRALEVFCQTDQSWICSLCAVQEHNGHDTDVDQAVRKAVAVLSDHPEDFHPAGFLNTEMPVIDGSLKTVQVNHKSILKKRFECVFEGIAEPGKHVLLNNIYTELYITEGDSGEVNNEHEVRQIEMAAKKKHTQETPIKCSDIFKPLPGQEKPIRTVLMKGIAGIGKTVSVQKFILDWATGEANQDIHFIVLLPFRELNLMKEERYSLLNLLYHYHPELKEVRNLESGKYPVLIIFDGLDESQLSLDFQNNQMCRDVTQSLTVDVLLTNLIRGNLLPSALLWITSRPAATSQIPAECVHQVTEVRGFNDEQKEEYFRKRVSDQDLASAIIKHIKSSRSLHIMCHIPVFCWISATVLERMLGEASGGVIPTTLTGMYTHFLLILINMKNQKYLCGNEESAQNLLEPERDNILKLCKLAFNHLQNGNLIFYTKDIRECNIDVSEASVYSGVCTQIFKEESTIFKQKVYCFVHLSIQEYLAALHVFFVYKNENKNLLNGTCTHSNTVKLSDLYKIAVDEALQSKNGHLDLFLRFLLGISVESNQTLLRGLMTHSSSWRLFSWWRGSLTQPESVSQSIQETTDYIKQLIRDNPSPERCINLFHCLNELNDNSLVEEIKSFLSSGRQSGRKLSSEQWSALVFVLLTSEESLDEFDLKKFSGTEEGCVKLLPVIKRTKRALLSGCGITEEGCAVLASALRSNPSTLRELDLSRNHPGDSGVTKLSAGLEDPNCKLETLRLSGCRITEEGCAVLASALRSNPSTLRELDLSRNRLGDSGVTKLSAVLEDPNCKLETLRLSGCRITEEGCAVLTSALHSNPSTLRELDLSRNRPGDSAVTKLSAGLEDPNCKLETLRLSRCGITEEGCAVLASALRSNPSTLRELDLSRNRLGDSGVTKLSAVLEDPNCKLDTLRLSDCGITEEGCAVLTSALRSNPSTLRELDLSRNRPGDSGVTKLSAVLEDPNCKLETLRLSDCGITEEGCAVLASALRSNPSTLRELDLSRNRPGDSGVTKLSAVLEDPNCKLETLRLSGCGIIEEGCAALTSALRSNPSTLRELDLSRNRLGYSGVTKLSAVLEDPNCKLETLRLSGCGITKKGCAALASALRSNPSTLRELDLSDNRPGDSGVTKLSAVLEDPNCKLETLRLSDCGITEEGCAALASALRSNPSTLRELDLRRNRPGDSGVTKLSAGLEDPNCKLETLRLSRCGITEEGCAALASALRSNPSTLRVLDLSRNHPGDSGVTKLSAGLEDPNCKLETLRLSCCRITKKGCAVLASALRSNPSTLRELDLSRNRPGDSGVTKLSAVLEDPNCKLETLRVGYSTENRIKPGPRK